MIHPILTITILSAGVTLAHAHESPGHAVSDQGHHAAAATATPDTAPEGVRVEDCWIRSMPAALPSGGYFVVHNSGKQPVTLTGVESPAYGATMLHQTVTRDGMTRMEHTGQVVVAPGGELAFKPGGYHMMLEKPVQRLEPGQTVDVTFLFGTAGRLSASCELRTASGERK